MRRRARRARASRRLVLGVVLGASACRGASVVPPVEPAPSASGSVPVAPSDPAQVFATTAAEERFEDPERRKKIESAFGSIDAMVDEEAAKQKLPGVALGIVVDGELVHVKLAGVADAAANIPVDVDTVFRLGSISKVFTTEALLMLRDEGKLTLDAPAAKAVPEVAGVVYPTTDAPPITLRHLLSHTSGLPRDGTVMPDETRTVTPAELAASLAKLPLMSSPGERYSYSNLGFGIAALAVERVSGEPYTKVIERRLLTPLGMTASGFDLPPAARIAKGYRRKKNELALEPPSRLGAYDGAGGLSSSVRDMARFLAHQLDAYPARNAPETGPLKRASLREAHTASRHKRLTVRANDGAKKGEHDVDARADAVGLGWHSTETCELDTIVSHNGAVDGFTSYLALLPRQGVGLVVLANLSGGDPDEIGAHAIAALVRTGGLSERRRVESASPALTSALDKLLAVQNHWDEAAYGAMLSAQHKKNVPLEREREELAEYARRHGACKPGPVVETLGARAAKFALSCERGRLVMGLALSEDELIAGFGGESFDLPPRSEVTDAAKRLASLVGKWSEAVHRQSFAPDYGAPKAELESFFAKVRKDHGACVVGTSKRYDGEWSHRFRLECDRGGDIALSVTLAATAPHKVAGLRLEPIPLGKCPVK